VAFFSARRIFHRTQTYMKRAHQIEKALGMRLYQESELTLGGRKLRGGVLWPSIPLLTATSFLALLLHLLYEYFR